MCPPPHNGLRTLKKKKSHVYQTMDFLFRVFQWFLIICPRMKSMTSCMAHRPSLSCSVPISCTFPHLLKQYALRILRSLLSSCTHHAVRCLTTCTFLCLFHTSYFRYCHEYSHLGLLRCCLLQKAFPEPVSSWGWAKRPTATLSESLV